MTNEQIIEFLSRYLDADVYTEKCIEAHAAAIEALKCSPDRMVEALEKASFKTELTFDEDGYSNDDAQEVVLLDEAIEIVRR